MYLIKQTIYSSDVFVWKYRKLFGKVFEVKYIMILKTILEKTYIKLATFPVIKKSKSVKQIIKIVV